ncbi:MAG: hypothetical protein LBH26_05830 [Treponema sp.]|nr:hypothetical protein [Treponema sp.]
MKMVKTGKGFVLKLLSACVVMFTLVVGACLNPISFNEDDLPTLKVIGEISTDNINSAELVFRNHTRTVDVLGIDIKQKRLEKASGGKAEPPQSKEKLDARISGSPTAGTQDTVLVRPTGANVTNNITVEGYTIQIWYKKAQGFPSDLEGTFTDLQNNAPLEITLTELPRGRCIFHIYRHKNGEIKVDVDGVTEDPNYTDHYYDNDFVMNVKSQTKIDLSGLELAVNLSPVVIGGQPVEIKFSDELLTTVNAAFEGLSKSMDNVATSVNNLALSVESSLLFGKNTGLLVVRNWLADPVEVEIPINPTTIRNIGPVAAGDLDGMLLSTSGGGKYNVRVNGGGVQLQTKNTYVFNQKVSYLHVYKDKGNNAVADILESPEQPSDSKIGYGRLRVRNYTNAEITNIVFKKKIGIGAGAVYDDATSFIVQRVGRGTPSQASSVISDNVGAGNYSVFCTLTDGSTVLEGLDFYILPNDEAYQAGDNVIEIRQEHITPPSPTILYTASGNGGPPALTSSNTYNTTRLILTFSSAAPGFAFQPVAMASGIGTTTRITDFVYEVAITNPKNETAKFKLSGANIDSAEHEVRIYAKDGSGNGGNGGNGSGGNGGSGSGGFVPVTNVIVLNNARFTKGTPKTIQWKVVPENATNNTALWTLGEADGNLALANITNTTPPYGLGSDGKQHSDPEGRLHVRTFWGHDYLDLAVVVYNGKAEGTRNPTINALKAAAVDINGNTVSVTVQALRYDLEKDFVKIFRFAHPDLADPVIPGKPPANMGHGYQNVIFNYIGRGAGGNTNYPGGEWSVNLIEVYRRPQYLTTANNTEHNKNPIGGGTQHKIVTDKGGGILTSGNPLTGKTGVWWQPNPMDERENEFGGTSEGWITGNWGSITESSGVANTTGGVEKALEALPYPPPGAPANQGIAANDRRSMAFAYQTGSFYGQYMNNFYGETKQYFWGSINLGDNSEKGQFTKNDWYWLQKVRDDGKLNMGGEQLSLYLPTDIGPLWIRLRMDYSDGTVGYWWKAVGLQEWFVFDPSQPYYKDSRGNIIIDVDLYDTPYMTYRKY